MKLVPETVSKKGLFEHYRDSSRFFWWVSHWRLPGFLRPRFILRRTAGRFLKRDPSGTFCFYSSSSSISKALSP